ncbi:hypothetical protein [Haloterrigena salinisoli]|uniref:hypothetical protein n=1 Tax=Haloterrigena salinisoli TaxID=3132747 RepID=UPI0030CFEBB1
MSDLVIALVHAVSLVSEAVLSLYARVTRSETETDSDATDERSTNDTDADG